MLLEKKYIVVKQIFIDEILYLFPFNYTYYNDLIKLIMSFNFVDEFSYILLIKVIVEFLDKTGSIYLVAFDQYNDSNDPNFLIKGILRKYINKENLYFLIFSSMNETDVRNIKMNSIMGELEEEDYHEIRKICDIKVKDWKIDKKLAFNKLGKTFKAMIELQYDKKQNEKKYDDFTAEGRNAVLEAVRTCDNPDRLYVQEGLGEGPVSRIIAEARSRNIMTVFVPKDKLDLLSETGRHQGVILKLAAVHYADVDDILDLAEKRGEKPFIFILDGIEDPHNLGAIIRTANLSGAHGVIIPKHRSASVNATVARASAGAVYPAP